MLYIYISYTYGYIFGAGYTKTCTWLIYIIVISILSVSVWLITRNLGWNVRTDRKYISEQLPVLLQFCSFSHVLVICFMEGCATLPPPHPVNDLAQLYHSYCPGTLLSNSLAKLDIYFMTSVFFPIYYDYCCFCSLVKYTCNSRQALVLQSLSLVHYLWSTYSYSYPYCVYYFKYNTMPCQISSTTFYLIKETNCF